MTRKRTPLSDPAPALSSLGDALRATGVPVGNPAVDAPAAERAPSAATPTLDLSGAGKIVIRRERKGHGGKTVTIVDGLPPSPAALEAAARELRKALGCGSRVDGRRLILQGERAAAAEAWLRERGAARIVQGN